MSVRDMIVLERKRRVFCCVDVHDSGKIVIYIEFMIVVYSSLYYTIVV